MGCAEWLGSAQPFLLAVLLINAVVVELPLQLTSALSSARLIHLGPFESAKEPSKGKCGFIGAEDDAYSLAVLHAVTGVARASFAVLLIIVLGFQLRSSHGRLFLHQHTSELPVQPLCDWTNERPMDQ